MALRKSLAEQNRRNLEVTANLLQQKQQFEQQMQQRVKEAEMAGILKLLKDPNLPMQQRAAAGTQALQRLSLGGEVTPEQMQGREQQLVGRGVMGQLATDPRVLPGERQQAIDVLSGQRDFGDFQAQEPEPQKPEFNSSLFIELAKQVTNGERTPEQARELFRQETGRDIAFTPGVVKAASTSTQDANTFFKIYDRGEEIKGNYNTISQNMNTIDTAIKRMQDQQLDPNKPENRIALSQVVITAFNKITDPDSVVRESEYNRTSEGSSLLRRMQAKVENITKGGNLSPDDLIEIRNLSREITIGLQSHINKRLSTLRNASEKRFGIDPDEVVPLLSDSLGEEIVNEPAPAKISDDVKANTKSLVEKLRQNGKIK